MLSRLWGAICAQFNIADALRENRQEIREVREDVLALARAVERQEFELKALAEREQHERTRLVLELENRLLRMSAGDRRSGGRR